MTESKVNADRQDVRGGVIQGILMAIGFSVLAGAGLLFGGAQAELGDVWRVWLLATAFYLVAGTLGGAVFGWLRPFRRHYWGKALTAYLILFLVYGGGTAAFWPMISDGRAGPTLATMLMVWAVLSAVLAPLYVWMSKSW